MFKTNQLINTNKTYINKNIQALEYKEICIAFDRAYQQLLDKGNVDAQIIRQTQAMRTRAHQRYAAFLKVNGLNNLPKA